MGLRLRLPAAIFSLVLFVASGYCQDTAPSSSGADPRVKAIFDTVVLRLTGGVPVRDVILSGTFTWTLGSDRQDGMVSLKALGTATSRVDFTAGAWRRSEIRSNDRIGSAGVIQDDGGNIHQIPPHNGYTDPVWFFMPLMQFADAAQTNRTFAYVGQKSIDGATSECFRYAQLPLTANLRAASWISGLSAVTICVDGTTLLPTTFSFSTHPDDDGGVDIPVEIRFSEYRAINGLRVPTVIEKYVNGAPLVHIAIAAASTNTGLQPSDFAF